jgi:hypothetical protein
MNRRTMKPHPSNPAAQAAMAGPSFGLGALLLVVCLLGICLGLGRVDPLLGIGAALIWTPALMRTAEMISQLRRLGRQPTSGQKLRIFAASLGLVAAVGGSTVGVALALAAVSGLCGWALAQFIAAPWLPVVAATWGLILGLLAGACCGVLVAQRWWRSEAAA